MCEIGEDCQERSETAGLMRLRQNPTEIVKKLIEDKRFCDDLGESLLKRHLLLYAVACNLLLQFYSKILLYNSSNAEVLDHLEHSA